MSYVKVSDIDLYFLIYHGIACLIYVNRSSLKCLLYSKDIKSYLVVNKSLLLTFFSYQLLI